MANYLVTDTQLTSVANAIRTKTGSSSGLSFPDGFVSGIGGITVGSPDVWDEYGKNPVLIYTYDQSLKLSETSYDSSNLSTSNTTILTNNSAGSITLDIEHYNYYIFLFSDIKCQYNTDEALPCLVNLKQAFAFTYAMNPTDVIEASDLSTLSWSVKTNTVLGRYLAQYKSALGNMSMMAGSSTSFAGGINIAYKNPTQDGTSLILNTPTIRTSLSNTYFPQTAADAINLDTTTINYTFKVYQYDKQSSLYEKLGYQLVNYSGISEQSITLENGNTLTDESGNPIIYNTLTN